MHQELKVATWNCLADCYATQGLYSSWSIRKQIVKKVLDRIKADIFCLQEVDHYKDFYKPLFFELGYESNYIQRPGRNDGCCIAFRRDSGLILLDSREVDLDSLVESTGPESYAVAQRKSRFLKQNVALMTLFRSERSDHPLLVTCLHLHWNPNLPEVKLAQMKYILRQLVKFKELNNAVDPRIVICGDYNSLPGDEVYRLLTDGMKPTQHYNSSLTALSSRSIEISTMNSQEWRGPGTRFLIDTGLPRLCRWLRIMGNNVAMDSWDISSTETISLLSDTDKTGKRTNKTACELKRRGINQFFERAKSERRVILTSSKTLLQRSNCPQGFYVDSSDLEVSLVEIYRYFGLSTDRDQLLSVCGKCGDYVEKSSHSDERIAGRSVPNDKDIFVCINCHQPYWWDGNEDSSPAVALRKATELAEMVEQRLEQSQRAAGAAATSLRTSDSDDDDDNDGANDTLDSNSNSVYEEVSTELETKDSSRFDQRFRSVFGSLEDEPPITNWNGAFSGTLDYIFVDEGTKVESCEVFPDFDLDFVKRSNAAAAETAEAISSEPDPLSNGLKKSLAISSADSSLTLSESITNAFEGLGKKTLRKPPPSEEWPSDHFAIISRILI